MPAKTFILFSALLTLALVTYRALFVLARRQIISPVLVSPFHAFSTKAEAWRPAAQR